MESEQTSVLRPLILVAEDDDSNFKLIKAIIGKKCDIEWAKNGEEMVQLFQEHQHRASAILMDIKMPLMNGLEATKIIRESNTEIPIIMQTAYAFSSDNEKLIYSLGIGGKNEGISSRKWRKRACNMQGCCKELTR